MQAAVYHGNRDVRVEDVHEPEVTDGTVKLRVRACGICGTDLHEYVAGPIFVPTDPHPITGQQIPVILGHELAGEVVEIGDGVSRVQVGDRVAVEPVLRCGECPQCRRGASHRCEQIGFHGISGGGGGLAELTVVPEYMVHVIPDSMSFEDAALVEPMAVSFHAVRVSGFRAGDTALVLGAGPIGVTTVLALRAAGARFVAVSEISDQRKKKARAVGADLVLDPREEDVAARMGAATDGLGVDVSFDAAGVEATWSTAMEATRPDGTVVSLAIWEKPIAIDLNDVVLTEHALKGSICYTPDDFATTIALMADGRLPTEGLVTRRVPLKDAVDGALEELVRNRDEHVKILVEM